MNKEQNLLLNPFQKISDKKALFYGVLGLLATTLLCYFNNLHFNGLLQVGIREENSGFPALLSEHLIIWVVPMLLFYIFGLILSGSRIRFIDIFGNTLFAQIPFMGVALVSYLPPVKRMMSITEVDVQVLQEAYSVSGLLIMLLLMLPFFVWMAIWMYKAYKISCNLSGVRLVLPYIFVMVFGDMLCRVAIYYMLRVL